MFDLKDYIKSKRGTLSASSLTTYGSILKSLYKKCWGEGEIEPSKFNDDEAVLECLKDLPPNKRKTILSALVIITDNQKYRDLMLSDVRDYNQEIKKQEKTPNQEENWASEEDIMKLWSAYKKEALGLYKKETLGMNDLQTIQSFIILSLLGGMFIPPRRAKDMTDFKIKSIDKNTDNYIEKGNLVFNSYKTSKTYGRQEVAVPKPLMAILKKKINNKNLPIMIPKLNLKHNNNII